MGTPIYGKHHIWVWQILPLVLISGLFFFIILRYPGTHCIPGWRETLQESCRIIQFPWHPTKILAVDGWVPHSIPWNPCRSRLNHMKSLFSMTTSPWNPMKHPDFPMVRGSGGLPSWFLPPRWSWRRRMDVSCVQMCEVRGESQGPSGA